MGLAWLMAGTNQRATRNFHQLMDSLYLLFYSILFYFSPLSHFSGNNDHPSSRLLLKKKKKNTL